MYIKIYVKLFFFFELVPELQRLLYHDIGER